jgi:hypothetical protein
MRAREVSSSNDDWARYDIQAAHSYDSSDLELTDLRVWQGVTQSTSNSSIVIQTDSTGAVGATNFDLHRPGQNAQSIKEWRSLADELPHRNGHLYCHEHAVREGLPRKQRDLLYGRMLSAQMVAMHLRRKLGVPSRCESCHSVSRFLFSLFFHGRRARAAVKSSWRGQPLECGCTSAAQSQATCRSPHTPDIPPAASVTIHMRGVSGENGGSGHIVSFGKVCIWISIWAPFAYAEPSSGTSPLIELSITSRSQ